MTDKFKIKAVIEMEFEVPKSKSVASTKDAVEICNHMYQSFMMDPASILDDAVKDSVFVKFMEKE